jgi:hypothetical protein
MCLLSIGYTLQIQRMEASGYLMEVRMPHSRSLITAMTPTTFVTILIHKRIYVGYGSGALAEIDDDGNKGGEIKLDAHPESFQLEKDSPRIYVNLPKSRKIAVLDREKRAIIATWPIGMALANYPMALDQADHRLFVITRFPARLLVFDTNTGKTVQRLPAVGDCDDVFYDQTP